MSEKRYTISCNGMKAEISNVGAQLRSLKDKNGKEYMWSADPAFWPKSAPIMFPICGGLRNDSYIYNGVEYPLEKHGFTMMYEFECESISESSVTFLLKSNEQTYKIYPFSFEFRVSFAVDGTTLTVSFSTKNTGNNTMYYSPGGHEAYACPTGIEDYDVIFDENEQLYRTVLDGNLLEHKTEKVETDGNVLHMKYSHMDNDCLNFSGIKSRGVKLVNRLDGKGVRVEFADFDYFVIWTKKGAPYLCLEPWNGIPDRVDSDRMIEHKEGIRVLPSGETQTFVHKITPIL